MKTSPWIVISGYCAMRCLEGSDPFKIENRVAFVEKTPRIRVSPFTSESEDHKNWKSGSLRASGGIGNPSEEGTYGFDSRCREWCDRELESLGYELGF